MSSRISQGDDGRWNLDVPAGQLRRSIDGDQAEREDLLRRHAALLESQREHRELEAFIVHDLKAPLSVVCAGLEWVRGHLQPEQTDLADAIADAYLAAGRLGGMIGDLLTVSRLDEGNFPLRRQPVRIQGLFDLIAHAYARRADEKGISLATAPEEGLEVQADPTLLRRVLENIVENAFRHTRPNGRIALAARPWNGVEIVVSNDGPPILALDRVRIFDKFERAERAGPAAGSVGLGLYFCKRAVEAHGGVIDIVETHDWPTSFRINLP